MTEVVAVRATPANRIRVVDTVVAAFAEDPAFHYFFDEPYFREQAAVFAAYLFDRRVGYGNVWVIDGGISVSMWDSPASSGSTCPPLDLPASVIARIEAFDAAIHHLLPATPHWYLGVVATHPAHAGQRWGRRTITAGLDEAKQAGLPAYLETATAGNVDLYRRSGWTLTGETKSPIPAWVMRFDPA